MVTLIYKSRFLMDIPTVGVSETGVVPPCLAIFIGENHDQTMINPWILGHVHIFLPDFPTTPTWIPSGKLT